MDSDRQLTLFSTEELKSLTASGVSQGNALQMDSDYLQQWKAQIHRHQRSCRVSPPMEQATLFDLGSPRANPEIDPLAPTLHSFSLLRLPA